MLSAEIATMTTSTTSTAAVGWQGAGGAAMTMTAQAFAGILGMAVAWFEEAVVQATAIVDAYHLAKTTMVPGPVSDQNLADTEALVATNFIGQNSPAIAALVAEYERQWIQNATIMSSYQGVVTAALGVLATPPPFAPMAPNPAAALAALGNAGAQAGVQGALQASSQSMQQASTAAVPAAEAVSAPADAMSAMGGPMGMMGQLVGHRHDGPGSADAGPGPQMLGQFMQMPMGMLGPLSSSMGGLGGARGVSGSADRYAGGDAGVGQCAQRAAAVVAAASVPAAAGSFRPVPTPARWGVSAPECPQTARRIRRCRRTGGHRTEPGRGCRHWWSVRRSGLGDGARRRGRDRAAAGTHDAGHACPIGC